VLVDGAHAPGAIAVDITALGVDWYAANLHKWAFAPRSCGVLWAAPGRRAGLHPAVISWGVTNDDWLQEFDWTGTRDPSPWLMAPAGLDFMHDARRKPRMRAPTTASWQSAERLAKRGRP
jgi:isopenicillin-N epimerase